MATERQNAANNANALKSEGPRSIVGKARSCQNALMHELTGHQTLLPGEKREEFEGRGTRWARLPAASATVAAFVGYEFLVTEPRRSSVGFGNCSPPTA